jgi:hypothetical protein|tara:strand:+ start:2958 stop:3320 length:363 start_codon:yes stop_codon:yes gene_type:complete
MAYCRLCKQNYPQSQFVSGNGPRYLVCVRCAVEHDLAEVDEVPQLYSDELVKARFALFSRRYRLWFSIATGWTLYFTLGNDIELWSSLFFGALVLGTLATPVLYFLGSARFNAELSQLTP